MKLQECEMLEELSDCQSLALFSTSLNEELTFLSTAKANCVVLPTITTSMVKNYVSTVTWSIWSVH